MDCPMCLVHFDTKDELKNHILPCVDYFFPSPPLPQKGKEEVVEKECVICFMEEECVDLVCGHPVCVGGLAMHAKTSVEQNISLVCPHGDCDKPIYSPFLAQHNVEKEIVEKVEQMELRKALDRETVACPFPNCENRFIVDEDVKNVFCEVCAKFFCKDCKELTHYGVSCDEFRRVKALNDDQAHQMLLKDERWKEKNCRLCPDCGNLVNKISGCDHIRCGGDPYANNGRIGYRVNKQKGCGKQFLWSKAKPYQSEIEGKVKRVELKNLQVPKDCVACGKGVKIGGEMNICLNCEGVMFCEKCVMEGRKHDNTHLVHLITKVKEKKQPLPAPPKEPVKGKGKEPVKDKGKEPANLRPVLPKEQPNYNRYTVVELRMLLGERNIKGRSRLTTKWRMVEQLVQWDREHAH